MAIQFKGATPGDAGPAGVVASFMLATTKGEKEAALGCLTKESREGGSLHEDPMETAVVTFGEVTEEDGAYVVPTVTAEDGEEVPMDLVVVEEDGELRIDMNATMARAMGFDPSEMMEQLAEGMGQMMEGVADSMAKGFEAMGEAMSGMAEETESAALAGPAGEEPEVAADTEEAAVPDVDVAGRTWSLIGDSFPPEEIVSVAAAAATFLDVDFDPDLEQLDTEQWGEGDSQTITTRYGTREQGYAVMQSRIEQESFASVSFTAAAYGLPGDRQLTVSWAKGQMPEMEPQLNLTVMMRAPRGSLDALGEMLEGEGQVLHVMEA